MQRFFQAAIAATWLVSVAGCGNPSTPTPVPTPTPTFTPTLGPLPVSARIDGNTTFTNVGQAQQLTLMVRYVDGHEETALAPVTWKSDDSSTATVTATGGLLVTQKVGLTTVRATYHGTPVLTTQVPVAVTPMGTYVSRGRVREPAWGPLEGQLVEELSSGLSTVTDSNGDYTFAGLTTGIVRFERQGYETVERRATPNGADDVPMQRLFLMSAGESLATILAPNDIDYEIAPGVHCVPCKRIRVIGAQTGTTELRLTWTEPTVDVSLWVDGRKFVRNPVDSTKLIVADLPALGGEQFVYVGGPTTGFVDHFHHMTIRLSATVK